MAGDRPDEIVERAYQVGDAATAAPGPLANRRGLIRAFGIVQIVLGGIFALAAVAVFFGTSSGLLAVAYGPAAANLLTTGIGSVNMFRWARRGTVVSAAIWFVLIASRIAAVAYRTDTAGYKGELELIGISVLAILTLGLPITLIVVYTRPSVRATFERRQNS